MSTKEEQIKKDWDTYWASKGNTTEDTYNFFADFYRNNIIRPQLTRYLKRHFTEGDKVLHAGCGSGKVDTDAVELYNITALDISPEALEIYAKVNPNKADIVLGNIFSLSFADSTFDGIYNLGVMEHFTEDEIIGILTELKRVLKPGGKVVLFIPPTFGLTVFVLDVAHFILNKILRKNVKLHPDEITRVKSKKHIKSLLEKSGFVFCEYYFGIKDMFTQVVAVGQKP